jgi:hypothetical protein
VYERVSQGVNDRKRQVRVGWRNQDYAFSDNGISAHPAKAEKGADSKGNKRLTDLWIMIYICHVTAGRSVSIGGAISEFELNLGQ